MRVTLVVETEPVCLVMKFVVEVVVMSSHCTAQPWTAAGKVSTKGLVMVPVPTLIEKEQVFSPVMAAATVPPPPDATVGMVELQSRPLLIVRLVVIVAVVNLPVLGVVLPMGPAEGIDVEFSVVKLPAAAAVVPIAGGEARYVLNPVPETVPEAEREVNAPPAAVVPPIAPGAAQSRAVNTSENAFVPFESCSRPSEP